jgi:hypothetical protein
MIEALASAYGDSWSQVSSLSEQAMESDLSASRKSKKKNRKKS